MALASCSLLVVALLAASPFSNQAHKRPDFSGSWVGVSPGDTGFQQTVTLTEKNLEVRIGSEGHRVVYNLDGSESRNQIDLGGEKIVTVSRASWKGEQLILTHSTTFPDGSKSEGVDSWSLDSQGQLVVEGTEKMTRANGTPNGTGKLHLVLRRK